MLFVLDYVARSIIDLAISSGDLSNHRSFVPTCKIKWSGLLLADDFTKSCIRAVFAPEKVLTNTSIWIQFFGHFSFIKVFYHTVSYGKYRFLFLFPFLFFIFVITCYNYFLWFTTTIQRSYDCYVLIDLLRCIFLLLILLAFFLFNAEPFWSVFILAFVTVDGFCVL